MVIAAGGIGIARPDRRGGQYVLATSDAADFQKAGADEILPGSNDQASVITALTRLPSSKGVVKIVGRTFVATVDADADQIVLTSDQYVEFEAGVQANVTITGATRYLFHVDGSSTDVDRAGVIGAGRFTFTATQDNQGLLRAQGQFSKIKVGDGLIMVNDSPSTSDGPCILMQGNRGWGGRDCYIGGTYEDWAYDSGDDEDGAILVEQSVKATVHVTSRHNSNGVSMWLRDMLPSKVFHFDSSAVSYTDLTNAYDGDTATTVAATLDTSDRFLIAGSQAFQSIYLALASATENDNKAYMIIEVTPDGGSNWYTVKTRHDGSMATNGGTYCSFRTSGEISFGWPKESEWGSSTINAVTGWWLSMRFVDDAGTPAAVALSAVSFADCILAKMPYDPVITGTFHDMGRTALQLRGVKRPRTSVTIDRCVNHGLNFNSDETTVLASGDDRFFSTEDINDDSIVTHCSDTTIITRAVRGGTLKGTYTDGDEAGWEQGSGISDFHKPVGVNFTGTIARMGRECVRMTGDGCRIGGLLLDPHQKQDLSPTGQSGTFISIIKAAGMTSPSGNLISAHAFNSQTPPSGNSFIWSESDATGTNYVRGATWHNLAGVPMNDQGGGVIMLDDKAVQIIVFEFTTDVATGDGKAYFHVDQRLAGHIVVDVHAEDITAGTTGTTDIQIANVTQAFDILSTKLTIDSGETGSDTAATAAVINTSNDLLTLHDLMRIDVDAISTTAPKGLIITIGARRP